MKNIQQKEFISLTPRQKQVLLFFSKGFSYKKIAKELGLSSAKTIEEHLDAIREKLAVSTRRECIAKAVMLGILKSSVE